MIDDALLELRSVVTEARKKTHKREGFPEKMPSEKGRRRGTKKTNILLSKLLVLFSKATQ
jgi:hypothetical protein